MKALRTHHLFATTVMVTAVIANPLTDENCESAFIYRFDQNRDDLVSSDAFPVNTDHFQRMDMDGNGCAAPKEFEAGFPRGCSCGAPAIAPEQ